MDFGEEVGSPKSDRLFVYFFVLALSFFRKLSMKAWVWKGLVG